MYDEQEKTIPKKSMTPEMAEVIKPAVTRTLESADDLQKRKIREARLSVYVPLIVTVLLGLATYFVWFVWVNYVNYEWQYSYFILEFFILGLFLVTLIACPIVMILGMRAVSKARKI